jgi:uncharacterized membrane protein
MITIGAMKRLSDRRIAAFFSLVLASGLCIALLTVWMRYPYGGEFEFLDWNLFLAWIPFVLAVVLHDGARRGRGLVFLGTVGAVWLLFLPNAPYIVTDFVHVGRVTGGVPVWYDAAMVAAFAAVGLVLGLVSILLVQGVVERRFGAVVGWLMLAPVFFLCSAGIYIGRVHRLNSWDAITSPGTLLRGFAERLADPLAQPEALVALVGAMGLLMVAYLVVYTISDLGLDRGHSDRS